jgi:dipeptidyl aminopeptidase/acylaminoacyl peptidase
MTTPFQPGDLRLYQTITDLDCVPASSVAACQVQSIDSDNDGVTTRIWLVPTDGRAPLQLTSGNADSMPRWSPDGTRLAFLSNRGAGQQVYMIDPGGGEARQLSHIPSGVSSIDWAPDGKKLVVCCTLRVNPEMRGDHGKEQNANWSSDAPKVIWRLPYKMDGVGYILNSEIHAYTLDAASGEATSLTGGSYQVMSTRFSPDSRSIAYTRTREGRLAHRTDLWLMNADGSYQRQVTFDLASVSYPTWSPDGRHIVLTGSRDDGDAQLRLWRYDVQGGSVTPLGDDSIEIVSGQNVHWMPDSSGVVVVLARHGRQEVAAISVPDGRVRHLLTGDRHISRMACASGCLAYVSQDASSPNELWRADLQGREESRLTDFNAWWRDRIVPTVEAKRFNVPDGEGGFEQVDGWLLRPPKVDGADDGATPLLVDAHGGPASYVLLDYNMHTYWYVLVSRGWSVLALNPVGSSSYGREFSSRLRQHWGKYDLDQHLAAIEDLRQQGLVDDRIAITGKSYGGFLSAWAVCNTTAFRAAVVSAPVTSLENHFGVSDSGYYADTYSMYGELKAKRDVMRELSPMDYVENVRTPTLILQGEADERCPKCQAEELYTGIMVSTQAKAELVLYPGASHHFLESGKPSHRVDAATRLVEWMERWIDSRLPQGRD